MFYKPLTEHLPTIYALATPSLQKSAIAIIRISGSQSTHIYQRLTKKLGNENATTSNKSDLTPRRSYLRKIYDSQGKFIDESMILFFKGPHSFTGEDSLEVHCHGGKAIIQSILNHISFLNTENRSNNVIDGKSIRYATNGEFAQRSFQNGKKKLLELESMNNSINATTWQELSSMNRTDLDVFHNWKNILIDSIAKLTAYIDFINTDLHDDGDDRIEQSKITNVVIEEMTILHNAITKFKNNLTNSNLLKDGIKISIIGAPNVGKSSLLNKLNNDDIAIVSDIPGTTRDSIDTILDINGFKTIICDTAGIRNHSLDPIEKIGMTRSKRKIKNSNIILYMLDINKPLLDFNLIRSMQDKHIIFILNKLDLLTTPDQLNQIKSELMKQVNHTVPDSSQTHVLPMSCTSLVNTDELVTQLTKIFNRMMDQDWDPLIMSQRVQDIIVNDILFNLNAFLENPFQDITISCTYLQNCLEGIAKILGESVGLDDILDKVFKQFCIGK